MIGTFAVVVAVLSVLCVVAFYWGADPIETRVDPDERARSEERSRNRRLREHARNRDRWDRSNDED